MATLIDKLKQNISPILLRTEIITELKLHEAALKDLRIWAGRLCGEEKADRHALDCIVVISAKHDAEIHRLEEDARKFYNADGTFELVDTAERVIYQRKEAAVNIERLQREIEDLKYRWQSKVQDIQIAANDTAAEHYEKIEAVQVKEIDRLQDLLATVCYSTKTDPTGYGIDEKFAAIKTSIEGGS